MPSYPVMEEKKLESNGPGTEMSNNWPGALPNREKNKFKMQ